VGLRLAFFDSWDRWGLSESDRHRRCRRPNNALAQSARKLNEGLSMFRAKLGGAIFLCLIPTVAFAKDTQFWNLTANTIASFQLSPTGRSEWGPNQTDNDSDRTVDHDERLKISGVKSGIYDVKFVDKTGRVCVVADVPVKEGAIFSIDEKKSKTCEK
jgi:hypothetical protein